MKLSLEFDGEVTTRTFAIQDDVTDQERFSCLVAQVALHSGFDGLECLLSAVDEYKLLCQYFGDENQRIAKCNVTTQRIREQIEELRAYREKQAGR